METLTREELAQLAAPFDPSEIAFRPGAMTRDGDKALALVHITARHAQDRLDEVVPGEWSFDWDPISNTGHPVAKGILTVRGQHYADCGEAESDDQDAWKSAVSDAFKRCAVQVGIGRFLYAYPQVWVRCESREFNGKKKFNKWLDDPGAELAKLTGNKPSPPKPNPKPAAKPADDKRRKIIEAIFGDWDERQELDSAFSAWKRRKNSIIGQMKAAWPAIETADMNDEEAVLHWLETADLDQVRAYGKHNRKRLGEEREAAELAEEEPGDGDE